MLYCLAARMLLHCGPNLVHRPEFDTFSVHCHGSDKQMNQQIIKKFYTPVCSSVAVGIEAVPAACVSRLQQDILSLLAQPIFLMAHLTVGTLQWLNYKGKAVMSKHAPLRADDSQTRIALFECPRLSGKMRAFFCLPSQWDWHTFPHRGWWCNIDAVCDITRVIKVAEFISH